jgi:excisionase family DNA binding protein
MSIIADQIEDSEAGAAEAAPVLLTSGKAAAVLQVVPQTVARWGDDGTLSCTRTPGGHRRFREDEVLALRDVLAGQGGDAL